MRFARQAYAVHGLGTLRAEEAPRDVVPIGDNIRVGQSRRERERQGRARTQGARREEPKRALGAPRLGDMRLNCGPRTRRTERCRGGTCEIYNFSCVMSLGARPFFITQYFTVL